MIKVYVAIKMFKSRIGIKREEYIENCKIRSSY